jgi:hypothetical protein
VFDLATISVKVDGPTLARWQRVFGTIDGETDDDRINTLLDLADDTE